MQTVLSGGWRAQKALPFFSHIFKILFIIHVCLENYSRHEGKKECIFKHCLESNIGSHTIISRGKRA